MAAAVHFGFRANCVGLTRDIPSPLAYLCSSSSQFNCKSFSKLTTGIREIKYKKRRFLQIRCESADRVSTYEENIIINKKQLSIVMKFGGSSVATAARMKEVVDLILSFPEECPVIVLSAMGKTTNNLLLAGEKAVSCGVTKASEIDELTCIKELHLRTVEELGLEGSVISGLLDDLEHLLKGIAMMKELTLRTRDHLVSYGERMCTRIFAAYLNKTGMKARQV